MNQTETIYNAWYGGDVSNILIIREFLPQDLLAIQTIEKECFKDYAHSEQVFNNMIADPDSFTLVSESDKGQIVGFITTLKEIVTEDMPYYSYKKIGYIPDIGVLQNFRKLKIGMNLLKQAELCLIKYNANYCQLETQTNNKAANSLFKKLGYEITNKIKGHYYGKWDAYSMLKKLE